MRTHHLIMAFYENAGMLARHLDEWSAYPQWIKDKLRVTIVDDGSPDPAIGHLRDVGFPIALYRVDVDIPWNWDGARNLAMRESAKDGEVCLLTDMDHLLEWRSAAAFCAMSPRDDAYFVPARRRVDGSAYKRHPNSWIMPRELFWEAGGYCEDFAGFYGKDKAFRRQIDTVARRVETDLVCLTLFGREDVPDASTTRYGRKGTEHHTAAHPAIRARTYTTHIDRPTSWCRFPWHREQ